eukprot:4737269-Amphidinium_carterae.4
MAWYACPGTIAVAIASVSSYPRLLVCINVTSNMQVEGGINERDAISVPLELSPPRVHGQPSDGQKCSKLCQSVLKGSV